MDCLYTKSVLWRLKYAPDPDGWAYSAPETHRWWEGGSNPSQEPTAWFRYLLLFILVTWPKYHSRLCWILWFTSWIQPILLHITTFHILSHLFTPSILHRHTIFFLDEAFIVHFLKSHKTNTWMYHSKLLLEHTKDSGCCNKKICN